MLCVCVCVCVSCTGSIEEEIKEANKLWMRHLEERDFDALAALYTRECLLLPQDSPPLPGRDAVKAVTCAVSMIWTCAVYICFFGDLVRFVRCAWERSEYVFYTKDNTVLDVGKYIVIVSKHARTNMWMLASRHVFKQRPKRAR